MHETKCLNCTYQASLDSNFNKTLLFIHFSQPIPIWSHRSQCAVCTQGPPVGSRDRDRGGRFCGGSNLMERKLKNFGWSICAKYSNLGRGHPRCWFRKGIPPKNNPITDPCIIFFLHLAKIYGKCLGKHTIPGSFENR